MQLPDPEQLVQSLAEQLRPAVTPATAMVGLRTGGLWLAERLHAVLKLELPLGALDVSFYRDDFQRIGLHEEVEPTSIPFEVEGRHIILVDDVLYTGRTIRAAMNELFDYGRPARIDLAVLVDRGGRELPIAAGFLGAAFPVQPGQSLQLHRDDNGRFRLTLEPATIA